MNSLRKKNVYLVLSISIIVFLICYNVINAEEKIKIYADEIKVDEISKNVKATGIPINIRRKSDPIIKINASHHSIKLRFFFYN